MAHSMTSENKIAQNIYEKVSKLYSEMVSVKLFDNCSKLDKRKIDVIINEIKYDANRMKNIR